MRRSWRRGPGAAVTVLVAVALAGCGTTEAPDDAGSTPTTGNSAPITVTDGRGRQVTLDGPATRPVGLEWNVAEHLVSLGVPPVGVADVEGYTNWVKAAPLAGDVTDVGVRGEPSVEAIAALRPDLVLATTDLPDGAVTQLEAIAPVVLVRPADASDSIGQMRRNVELVATLTGTQAAAQRVLADFDTALTDGAARLAAAGLAGRRFAFADGYLDGGRLSIRPFTEGSLVESVSQELGLVNAWPLSGDADYGLATTDVEGLTTLGDVEFVYYANDADGPDPFVDGLAGNAVWASLPFVQAGNVTRLPDGIWMFGGPASMRQYVDAVTAALAG
ncbi:ABC transporter substrate-binding protein [Pseudonocardia xinjiangensis]|uniref:ABC transporter substrate-binding protein n=1 Tax=Pseudonocardia xinjiangensis TaxID=75289 RepID=UPI003D94B9E7